MKVGWARMRAPEEKCESAARRALAALAASGTTAVGDITTIEGGFRAVRDSGLRGVVYFETIGFKPERVESERERLRLLLERCPSSEKVHTGISPHTPYTVGPRLWKLLHAEFRPRVNRYSVHVSEILEEAAFLEGGWGSFRALLRGAGLLEKGWKPPRMSPLEYVDSFGFVAPGTSLVHGNFLTEADRRLLAERQKDGAVCIVHCPRAHRFFRRLPFPLAELQSDGIPVALGTDSLASNPSLDMLEEMKTLSADHPGLSAAVVLRMATLHGAEALGLEKEAGTLEVGKSADLAVIDVGDISGDASPEEWILGGESRCVLTMVAGETVFARP
jgi:cytosine/adenosine deaminase-related metal-dependent hydrolase